MNPQGPMRVLVADDDEMSRRLLRARLSKWGFEVIEAENGKQAIDCLRGPNAPQIVILDWIMPLLSGPQVCEEIRKMSNDRYVYVLLLTGKSEQEDIVTGLQSGADDYLVKPFNDNILELRLRAGKRIIELQTTLIKAREAAQFQASHDILTRIWNRRRIFDELKQRIRECQQDQGSLGVILFDIDHFKQLNDSHGHLVGDTVLRTISQRVLGVLEKTHRFGRYGGEEFLIVVSDCTQDELQQIAERTRTSICENPVQLPTLEISLSASFGIAWTNFQNDQHQQNHASTISLIDTHTILKAADHALYQAKQNGRNCVVIANSIDQRLLSIAA